MMDAKTAQTEPRELTREERAAIRALVVKLCANYDHEYGCLPLDCNCYMLGKWWTGSYCKYFRAAVLPNDPILEAALTGRNSPAPDTRLCPVCGAAYVAVTCKAYCSPKCQKEGNRRKSRERMRKKRQNKRV